MVMKRFHYAWIICAACTLANICNLGLCGTLMSAYMPYIAATGVSGTVISNLVSVRSLFALVGLFFVSVYYRKVSLRSGIALASGFAALTMIIFSVGGSELAYYAGSALAGIVVGIGASIPSALLMARWFQRRRGLALAICASGSGISLICFPALLDAIVVHMGLRAMFLCLGGFALAAAALEWLLIRNTPEEMGLEPFNRGPVPKESVGGEDGFCVPVAVGVLLLVMTSLVSSISSTGSSHLTILMTSSGYDSDVAALFLSLFGLFLTGGKFLYGEMTDRMGTYAASMAAGVILVVGLLVTVFMDGVAMWPCAVVMLFLGLGYPPSTVGISLWAADFSTPQTYERTLKRMNILGSAATVVLASVPGRIYDAFGHYQGGYIVLAVGSLLCLPLLMIAYRSRRPVSVEKQR